MSERMPASTQGQDNPAAARPTRQHRPLREDIRDIDQEILRLLLRRHNLLQRMRKKGRLDPEEERFLREAWQRGVSKISRDAELAGRFFTMMQSATFLPRPENAEAAAATPQRHAFNLAPAHKPVSIALAAPLDSNLTKVWLYFSAASGLPLTLSPALQNDSTVDFIKALEQMGHVISRSGEHIGVKEQVPLGTPDRVVYAGDSGFNFFLLLAHYLGQPSRVKFTGDVSLKVADFSSLGHFLPTLGARLVHIVPRSDGLPARLESSGLLPPAASFPASLPWQLAEALILAAPFYKAPFALDVSGHPMRETILAHVLPPLAACGVPHIVDGGAISIEPASISLPEIPEIYMDAPLGAVLLALATLLGGKTELRGRWPVSPQAAALDKIRAASRLDWLTEQGMTSASYETPLRKLLLADLPARLCDEAECWRPLLAGMAAAVALAGGEASFPLAWLTDSTTCDFFRSAALAADDNGCLSAMSQVKFGLFTAPSPEWAMGLALASCGKSGLQLGNPGIMTHLWPGFWALYNSLPCPRAKTPPVQTAAKQRRRIITSAVAVPPEIREEDWA